jgi:hypothetical protein
MLFFVAGLPGRFAEWCDAVTARLVQTILGPTRILHANTLDEISRGLLSAGPSQAVLSSRQPGGRLRTALIAARRPFVLALDDPRVALSQIVRRGDSNMAAAIRAVAGSCAGVAGYISAPGALVLNAEPASHDAEASAAVIADHFQLAVNSAAIAEIVRDLGNGGITPERGDEIEWWETLESATKAAAIGALGSFVNSFAAGKLQPIHWVPDLFILGDRPAEPGSGAIDITGRARCLMHGPHIMLPPGCWSLALELVFSPEAAEYEFAVEVSAGALLGHRLIRPQRGGGLETNIEFVVDEGGEHPIDIRLSSQRATFDGTVRLAKATLLPQPGADGETAASLAAAEN